MAIFGNRSVFLNALFLFASLCGMSAGNAMQIPPFFINSVVAIGNIQSTATPGLPDRFEWQTIGTGFFYGYLIANDPDPVKRKYQAFLVTAKHVVQGQIAAGKGELKIRINPKERSAAIQEFSIPNVPKPGQSTWIYHPDNSIDIAVVPVNFDILKSLGYEPNFFPNDRASMNRHKLIDAEVAAGDGIFVLGFPMNLAGAQKNHVIVRQGVIARISEMLESGSNTFMIDSFVFPGNSGGPVVLKPDTSSIQGTKPQLNAALIGVVTSYRPYTDVAVSPQTKRARVLFEENSGLAEVLPIDYVDDTIREWRKLQRLNDVDTTSSIPIPKVEPAK